MKLKPNIFPIATASLEKNIKNDLKPSHGMQLALCLSATIVLGFSPSGAQAGNVLWSSSGGSAWLTGSNWTGSAVPTAADNAQFGANPTGSSGAGINFNSTTNAGTQTLGNRIQDVGAIELTSARTSGDPVIGNSSGTAGASGTLRLSGTTVNSVTNVILRNNSSQNLTIQNTQGSGSQTMALSLGNVTENKIVLDGSGSIVVSNVIKSDSGTTPLTIMGAGSGRVDIAGSSNTFTGNINVSGVEVRFTADGSMGHAANDILIDGGRFAKASDSTTVTLGAGRDISIGDTVGTAISSPGSGILAYNNAITNITGKTGSWAKQGGGTLELGGASTYTGNTAFNNGTVKLTTGNDRLPTGTVVSMGQAASANLGTLDLNARNQQIAGLNSTAGTNAIASNNTVISATAATLTVGGAGTYSYGDGTNANSGVITGAISLVKSGTGTQILGDTNTYTGTTTIDGGILAVNGSLAAGSAVTVNSGGTLGGSGTVNGTVTVKSGGIVGPGNSPGVLTTGAASFENSSIFSWELNSDVDRNGTLPDGTRGLNYDGLTASSLSVASGAIFRVVITGTASPDFSSNFWDANQTWNNIFSVSGSTTNSEAGKLFNAFGGSGVAVNGIVSGQGQFGFTDSTLTWTAVPEPSSALAGLLLAAGLLRRSRRGV